MAPPDKNAGLVLSLAEPQPPTKAENGRSGRTRGDNSRTLRPLLPALIILATTALFFALWAAQTILIPIAAAAFFAILLNPPVDWLNRLRVPRFVAAFFVLAAFLAVVGFAIINLSSAGASWVDRWPTVTGELENKLSGLRRSLQQASRAEQAISELTEIGPQQRRQVVVVETPSILTRAFTTSTRFLIGAGACLFLTLFFLVAGPSTFKSFIVGLPRRTHRIWTRHYAASTQKAVVQYIRTLAIVNIGVGTLMGTILYIVGFPNPLLFGTMIAAMNAIAYVGPVLIGVTLGIVGVVTFDQPAQWLLPFGLFWLIHILEANVVTPFLLGRRLSLNPIAVMLMLLLWGWLWGIAGVILAVPLLIAAKVVVDSTERFAVLRPLLGTDRERKLP
jgi:predicted PurR-regulated permease PerM